MSEMARKGMDLTAGSLVLEKGSYDKETIAGIPCTDSGLESLVAERMQEDGLAVAWYMHRIAWGRLTGGKLAFPGGKGPETAYLLEIRVFNGREELRLRREGDSLAGRYIRDGGSRDSKYVDSFSRFFGRETPAVTVDGSGRKAEAGYVLLEDRDRKLVLELPVDEPGREWYGLRTRNYVEASEVTGQAGFSDYRFVAVESAKEEA